MIRQLILSLIIAFVCGGSIFVLLVDPVIFEPGITTTEMESLNRVELDDLVADRTQQVGYLEYLAYILQFPGVLIKGIGILVVLWASIFTAILCNEYMKQRKAPNEQLRSGR